MNLHNRCAVSESERSINHTKRRIAKYAKSLGFDLVGFTPARINPKALTAYKSWLSQGKNADMAYLEKIEPRADLTLLLPNAKSVVVLATNYYRPKPPLPKNHGSIARYAYGTDYHIALKEPLEKLETYIQSLAPNTQTRSFTDSAPILERTLAIQAGLGQLGKNSTLITPQFGSWIFLSEILTTLDLNSVPGQDSNLKICKNCNICIKSCPANAITPNGQIDARRCLSYLTIEHKGPLPKSAHTPLRQTRTLFGCDICQQVCPQNKLRQKDISPPKRHDTVMTKPRKNNPIHTALNHKIAGHSILLTKIPKNFKNSPLQRTKHEGLTRTAKILT
ncbi:MAG: tRNA epoxyqueuosine(34) reductase QueG [Candidatus Peregrinibacteria bacterium]